MNIGKIYMNVHFAIAIFIFVTLGKFEITFKYQFFKYIFSKLLFKEMRPFLKGSLNATSLRRARVGQIFFEFRILKGFKIFLSLHLTSTNTFQE